MKKSILNLGKALNKAEQKTINGGKIRCIVYKRQFEGEKIRSCGQYGPQCSETECSLFMI